jgi:sugar lactone lactonase YvrE
MVFAVLVVLAVPVGAVSNYSTYTYSYDSMYLDSPDAYTATDFVSSLTIGLDVSLMDPKDLFVDENNQVFISDSGNNRVIVLDSYYNLRYIISTFVNEEGIPDSLTGPQGLFVKDGILFVCDTQANRIVKFDVENDGAFVGIVQEPKDSSFEEGSLYRPVAVAVDDFGRMFVVSSST